MPHYPIQTGRLEQWGGVRTTAEVQPDLAQAEQVEVVEQERGPQQQCPAEGGIQRDAADIVLHVPDHATDRRRHCQNNKISARLDSSV